MNAVIVLATERTPVNGAGSALGAILLVIVVVALFGGRRH